MKHFKWLGISLAVLASVSACTIADKPSIALESQQDKPNFLFFFIDDLHYNALGERNSQAITPSIDQLAAQSIRFTNAHAVLAVCSPSRATVLSGRYPSHHGVTTYGNSPLNPGNPSFIHALNDSGYRTSIVGKWHLGNQPEELGFQTSDFFHGNGRWYGRQVYSRGVKGKAKEFIETWSADRTIKLLEEAIEGSNPFFIWHNTQVPHMTSNYKWPATDASMNQYEGTRFPLPASYPPNHEKTGKPPYLKTARSYTKAMDEYNYKDPESLHQHIMDYQASVTDMDKEIGRVMSKLEELGLADNTYIIFMADNGWMLGEHGLTSKVLPYDRSMKVPFFVSGPRLKPGTNSSFVNNTDLAPSIFELAGISTQKAAKDYQFHGRSFASLIQGDKPSDWQDSLYYESPTPQLIPRPFYAYKDNEYLYIETMSKKKRDKVEFRELYDVQKDPNELRNLALEKEFKKV